jgi:formate hydrogenlyase subunit 6/NADH:ubiquinone oxidoreductase subunit I
MLWFFRGIRRGVVTTRYPARPDESARFLPTPPAFRPWALTRSTAGRLEATCPSGALRLENEDGETGGGTLVFDVGRCTACGRCAAEAPHAVTSSGAFELAATTCSVLIKIIPLRGPGRNGGREPPVLG